MSDDDVLAALSNAAAADVAEETGEQAPTSAATDAPAGATQSHEGAVQPATPVAPEAQNTDTFDGGKFNPDELPAELQPAWKQLQAAFTQSTQSLAEQRKQFEALGDLEAAQQAIELSNRIADPSNWAQLYSELTAAMQEAGIPMPGAEAPAAEAAPTTPAVPNLSEIEDPEIAALAKMVQEQNAQLEALRSERSQELEAQRAEAQRMQFLGELQRQENAIREAHPNWDDTKIEAVYEMSSFYGGNLLQAAERLDTLLQAEREAYLNQKATAVTDSTHAPAVRGMTTPTHKVSEPRTIEEATPGAEEFFLARLAAAEQ